MMELQTFKNTDEYAKEAAKSIESAILGGLKDKKSVRVALSGGTSPLPVFKALMNCDIPWSRVYLFLVDERYVPLNSKASNYKSIKENLVDRVKQVKHFYHYNTRDPIQTIVDQYQKTLQQFDEPLFDLVVLGMGEDGHTASLFPNEDVIHEKNRLVVRSTAPDVNTQDRMSLTFPSILNSRKIIFLIKGKAKEAVVDRLLNSDEPIDSLPAKGVLGHADVSIFLDASS